MAATTKAATKRATRGAGKRRFLIALPESLVQRIEKRAFGKKIKSRGPYFRNSEVEFLVRRGLEAEGDAVPA